MKRLLSLLLLILAVNSTLIAAPVITRQVTFTAAGTYVLPTQIGTGISLHKITWNISGTASGCNIDLESGSDGVTYGTDVIDNQTCTSNGVSSTTTAVGNYLRINLDSYTPTSSNASVTVVYMGFLDAAAAGFGPGSPLALNAGGTGASLSDPNADRIMFWDDSAGTVTWLAPGNSVAITTTTLDTIQDIRTTATPQWTKVGIGVTPSTDIDVLDAAGSAEIRAKSSVVDGSAALYVENDARQWSMRVVGSLADAFAIRDGTAGEYRLFIDTSGHLYGGGDNTQDIGLSGTRFRTGYFGTALAVGTNPADNGEIRLPNAGGGIRFRNAANDANFTAFSIDSSNIIYVGTQGTGISLHGLEIADLSAPAANSGVMYYRDNGASKTQLVVRFPTGAIQVIATEP